MNKYVILAVAVVLIAGLGVLGYFYWTDWRKTPEEKALEKAIEAAATAAPTLEVVTPGNPLGDKLPELNTVKKTKCLLSS